MPRVLVVDDDRSIRRTLERFLGDQGLDVDLVDNGLDAEERIRSGELDLVLLDLGLPGKGGLEILEDLGELASRPPIVVISAYDDMESTVRAIQGGAYDYLLKPIDLDHLMGVLRRALDEQEVRRQLDTPTRVEHDVADTLMVGRSPAMRDVYKMIAQVSQTSSTVLITGESGTGKELVARALHESGTTKGEPFVAVNCAALSSGLLESELFGHARGAFTGAVSSRAGRLEVAGKGTILLDEIGELATGLQAKLLRVLQERTFERVGESEGRPLTARVLAATHRDLAAEVREGRFREDLLYRLRVVEIRLPPLRERVEDLPILIQRLLARIGREIGKRMEGVSPEAVEVLQRHRWPGNVRELYNVLQRAVVLSRGDVLTAELVALAGLDAGAQAATAADESQMSLADVERRHVDKMLKQHHWNKKRAAEALGISRPTLDRKIKTYRLRPDDDDA